ncbi:hypothetical protein JOF56_003686 [Kibdelosporangium banguiense]|uniref:Uncharacterized protein n=1 Tax=Kibdelosporangium banguiense TaxID=1365924 RepID=A0ABS4TG37_9PSEU|nr:hypothetical protein [Kibdelosporangium banguiense]
MEHTAVVHFRDAGELAAELRSPDVRREPVRRSSSAVADRMAEFPTRLRAFRCCGAPSLCGAACLNSQESHLLAEAHTVLTEALHALHRLHDPNKEA